MSLSEQTAWPDLEPQTRKYTRAQQQERIHIFTKIDAETRIHLRRMALYDSELVRIEREASHQAGT